MCFTVRDQRSPPSLPVSYLSTAKTTRCCPVLTFMMWPEWGSRQTWTAHHKSESVFWGYISVVKQVKEKNVTISEEQNEERSHSIVWWYGSGYFGIFCQVTARWTNYGWGGCCLLGSVQTPHFTGITRQDKARQGKFICINIKEIKNCI